MPSPSVTWTFTNGTTSDASQVNTNFTDLINALTDGSRDISIGTLTVAGAVTFNGTVTLGNASSDDITISGSLAASIPVKANVTYDFGSSVTGMRSYYIGGTSTFTTRLMSAATSSYTFTLPPAAPSVTGMGLVFDTSSTATFRYPDKFTSSKTSTYTATGDETIIPCDASGGSFTVNLPAASTMTGKSLTIIKTDSTIANPVTIDANASETIIPSIQTSQLTFKLFTQYESVTLKCDGTSWYVVGRYSQTDWSATATITATGVTSNPTKGTIAVDSIKWRRQGRDAIIAIQYRQTVAGSHGSGGYLITIPSIGTIDTNVLAASTTISEVNQSEQSVGVGSMTRGGVANNVDMNFRVYSTTQLSAVVGTLSWDSTVSSWNLTNFSFSGMLRIPITDWNP